MGALYMGDPGIQPSPHLSQPAGIPSSSPPKYEGGLVGGYKGPGVLGATLCITDDPCLSFPWQLVVGRLGGLWRGAEPWAARQGDPGQRQGQWVFVCQGDRDPPAAGARPDNGIMGALLVRGARAPPTHPQR